MPGRHFLLLRLALSASCALVVVAQSAWSQETETPSATLKINARTVLVDVVVLDKSNHVVPGLTKDDFKILEDGKPQEISFFEPNFGADTEVADTGSGAGHTLPANTFTNVPAVAPNNAVNILLLDSLNTAEGDQSYVHKEMVRYLASIPPTVRIAVFSLSEKLRIIQGFTDNSTALRASIARLAANPSTSALLPTQASIAGSQSAETLILEKAADSGSQKLADMAAALQQFQDQQAFFETNERTRMTLEAFQQIARYLSGVPGRKNLIWLVGSVPQCLAPTTSENELTTAGCPYEEKYAKTVDMLADARVSIYPIDAGGLQTDTIFDVTGPTASSTLNVAGTGATAPIVAAVPAVSFVQELNQAQQGQIENDFQNRTLAHLEMDKLALDTGGKAIYEKNALKTAMTKDIDHGSRYYTIAYTPSNHKEIGRERKIEIHASREYKLAYRRSYFEDTPKELRAADKAPATDPLRPLMDRGMPSFTQLRYQMKVAPSNPQPSPDAPHAGDNAELFGPYTRYTVNFSLATDGLTLVTGTDGVRRGTIEVALVAYSQEGKPLDWEVRSIGLAIRPEQSAIAEKSGIPFHFDIDAPPGDVYLRTGIYDASSSKAGTLEIPLSTVTMAQR
jgi:VWFA-related protein